MCAIRVGHSRLRSDNWEAGVRSHLPSWTANERPLSSVHCVCSTSCGWPSACSYDGRAGGLHSPHSPPLTRVTPKSPVVSEGEDGASRCADEADAAADAHCARAVLGERIDQLWDPLGLRFVLRSQTAQLSPAPAVEPTSSIVQQAVFARHTDATGVDASQGLEPSMRRGLATTSPGAMMSPWPRTVFSVLSVPKE